MVPRCLAVAGANAIRENVSKQEGKEIKRR
jgi:hypothetical protein